MDETRNNDSSPEQNAAPTEQVQPAAQGISSLEDQKTYFAVKESNNKTTDSAWNNSSQSETNVLNSNPGTNSGFNDNFELYDSNQDGSTDSKDKAAGKGPEGRDIANGAAAQDA